MTQTAQRFVGASRSFVKAHRDVQREIQALWADAAQKHDHREKWVDSDEEWDRNGKPVKVLVPGSIACPVCGPAGDHRRTKERELLATLPEPRYSTSPCVGCDGSKWVTAADSPPGYREVEPCEICSDLHAPWMAGLL